MERLLNRVTSASGGSTGNQDKTKYGTRHVIMLFIPVSLCMLVVCLSTRNIPLYKHRGGGQDPSLIYTPLSEVGSTSTRVLMSLANSLIFIAFVVVSTIVLMLLYKFRCSGMIMGWLALTTISLLSMFLYTYLYEVVSTLNVVVDVVTPILVTWNLCITGTLVIHWQGPLRLRQLFLVVVSSLLALTFYKFLPDWTGWFVLGAICIWDLIAVLSPCGPLRLLLKIAQKRNEPVFPSLIYSSSLVYMANLAAGREDDSDEQPQQATKLASTDPMMDASDISSNQGAEDQDAGEDEGVKLGLGDFIFYSILICKAAQLDWLSIACTFISILLGLSLTLGLLTVTRHALPALPISISIGLVTFFATAYSIAPFSDWLMTHQVLV